jgi:hypothetical protein
MMYSSDKRFAFRFTSTGMNKFAIGETGITNISGLKSDGCDRRNMPRISLYPDLSMIPASSFLAAPLWIPRRMSFIFEECRSALAIHLTIPSGTSLR